MVSGVSISGERRSVCQSEFMEWKNSARCTASPNCVNPVRYDDCRKFGEFTTCGTTLETSRMMGSPALSTYPSKNMDMAMSCVFTRAVTPDFGAWPTMVKGKRLSSKVKASEKNGTDRTLSC